MPVSRHSQGPVEDDAQAGDAVDATSHCSKTLGRSETMGFPLSHPGWALSERGVPSIGEHDTENSVGDNVPDFLHLRALSRL